LEDEIYPQVQIYPRLKTTVLGDSTISKHGVKLSSPMRGTGNYLDFF